MLAGQALDAAIAGVALVAVRGTWWRAVGHHLLGGPPPGAPAGSPPQPLWPMGSSRFGGRFTPKGGAATVYLASDAQTALLEVGAIFAIPNGPPVAAQAAPYTLCQVSVSLDRVLDLQDPAIERALVTTTQEMTAPWRGIAAPVTHALGIAAHACGRVVALRAHSAKNVGAGAILAVFGDRLAAVEFIEVIDPTGNMAQRLP